MQSTSCEMPGWMKPKLESRLLGEISTTSNMQQRRQWHPTPVLLPGESQGQGSLMGCRLWGHTELDIVKQCSSSCSKYADDITLMAESEEELKSLLMKVNEETEKAGLKLNILNTKIMASGPITLWQIYGEKSGNRDRFYFPGLQKSLQMVTAALKLKDACSLEEKL